MSHLYFEELTAEETRNLYPTYSRRDITCFSIIKDGYCVGLYGLIDRGFDKNTGRHIGEGFLNIFPDFRFQILNKTFLQSLFDHALATGFQKVYTWTRLPSWQKVLQRFERWNIHLLETSPPWDSDQTKMWFVKEQPHNQDHEQDQQLLKKKDPKKGDHHVFRR